MPSCTILCLQYVLEIEISITLGAFQSGGKLIQTDASFTIFTTYSLSLSLKFNVNCQFTLEYYFFDWLS